MSSAHLADAMAMHHHAHPDMQNNELESDDEINAQGMDDEDEGQLRDIDPAEHPGEHHHHDGLGDDIHGLNGVNDVGAELGLNALRDSPEGVKPFYPYSTLIRYAIKGSPGQRLLLEDIYYAIETRFPWFKTAPAGWKNSIRHNLSLNSSFQKVPRPLTDRGKGAYWTVNDQVDPRAGVHRVRKKKPRGPTVNGKHNQAAHDAQLAAMGVPMGMQFNPQMAAAIAAAAGPGGVAVPGAGGERDGQQVVYPGFPFDPNAAAAYAGFAGVRFPTNGENVELSLSSELDEAGRPIWRSIWLNELLKLQHATAEAERNGQDQDWYRGMIERLRIAFAPQPGYDDEEAIQAQAQAHAAVQAQLQAQVAQAQQQQAAVAAAQAQAVAQAQAQAAAAAQKPQRRSGRVSTRARRSEGEEDGVEGGGAGEGGVGEGGVVQEGGPVGVDELAQPGLDEIDGDDEDNDPDYAEDVE